MYKGIAAWVFFGLFGLAGCGEAGEATDSKLNLFVFDCGAFTFDDVTNFGLSNDETPVRDLFVPCYLIKHAGGTLLWDAGLALDLVGKGDVEMGPGVRVRYQRSVLDQLQDIGYAPADIDLIAFSHMHFDHVGAANAFKTSKLLIQRTEHVAAFEHGEDNPVFEPALYSELATSTTTLLDGDHDVFGDGSVVIVSAPGHTPGHQVLYIDLPNTGPLVLSGDLYHFRESRALRRAPVFNTDAAQTFASMDKVEAFIEEKGATLWIEHDQALANTLKRAPAFYD